MKRTIEIAAKLGIPETAIEPYGHHKAKVSLAYLDSLERKPNGKLILVIATPSNKPVDANAKDV